MGTTGVNHLLKAWRKKIPMTQQQAADLVGITQKHWNRLENRRAWASPTLARKISDLTGLPLESLLNFGDTESVCAK